MGRPNDSLDLPNLGPAFDDMTALELDGWLSGEPVAAYVWSTAQERAERQQRHALRELDQLQHERTRLEQLRALRSSTEIDFNGDSYKAWDDGAQERLSATTKRIAQLDGYLKSAGWSISLSSSMPL